MLERASDLAPLDARYPSWNAKRFGVEKVMTIDHPTRLLQAHRWILLAVRRAPLWADNRFYLSGTLTRLGEFREADGQAWAAWQLAPLREDLSVRVARYSVRRYRHQRDPIHIGRAMKAGGDEVLAELLADPLLSFEDLQSGFDQVDLARSEQVRILTEGGRFGWAVRAAELSADPRLLGRARAAHAEWLASQGLFEIALEPAESARELLGANFEAWPTLARVRLYAGKTAAGLEALGQALDRGLELREAGEILAGAGVGIEIEGVIEFWVERAVTPEGSLEYGRALLLGGRAADALRVLLPLCETENMAAPHALAARACVALSNESMAAAHAERAVELDPKNREYREFAESLREKREKRE